MPTLGFTKMHGAGNDFVMVDGTEFSSPLAREKIAAICDRRRGVGADGLIVVGPDPRPDVDFRMVYYNADGGEAEMCGNGARCAVAFAAARGLHGGRCRFATASGVVAGEQHGAHDVEVLLPGWQDLALNLKVDGSPFAEHHACNTGVPHLVIVTDDVDAVDVRRWGARLRFAEQFAPAGTNVNWIAPAAGGREWALRTYERGVEDETLACGTGASAAAVILCHLERLTSPVSIRTRGGDVLVIGVDLGGSALSLRGPAVTSFRGEVTIDE